MFDDIELQSQMGKTLGNKILYKNIQEEKTAELSDWYGTDGWRQTKIDDIEVESVSSVKYLGSILTEDGQDYMVAQINLNTAKLRWKNKVLDW